MTQVATLALAAIMGGNPAPNIEVAHAPQEKAQIDFVKGVLAIRGHMKHVDRAYAKMVVDEARTILSREGNDWFPLENLLALAVVESDLRWWLKRIGSNSADCGISQINVHSMYQRDWVKATGTNLRSWRSKCRWLSGWKNRRQSIQRSLRLSLFSLNKIRKKWCCSPSDKRVDKRGRPVCRGRRFRRGESQLQCILNVYRQGPRWSHDWRVYKCKPFRPPWMSQSGWENRRKICRMTNRYYLWNFCFARGILLGRKPRRPCRWAYAQWWIRKQYANP